MAINHPDNTVDDPGGLNLTLSLGSSPPPVNPRPRPEIHHHVNTTQAPVVTPAPAVSPASGHETMIPRHIPNFPPYYPGAFIPNVLLTSPALIQHSYDANSLQQLVGQEVPPLPQALYYPTPVVPMPQHQEEEDAVQSPVVQVHSQQSRSRVAGAAASLSKSGKSEMIVPPFPWATNRRATVHPYEYLMENGMAKIRGQVQCKRCDKQYEMEFDLKEKFAELWQYIAENKCRMHNRAPKKWLNPTLPNCQHCEQSNCVKPVPSKKKAMNWLFLLLGELLGCCKLSELKYFCKHTSNHRTGAKDRVLYITYLVLCNQLNENGPFQL